MLHSRLVNYIDQVARHGSIRKAAEKVHISSSSINRQIIAYEEMLGHDIFERLPRGVRLTPAGEVLLQHIRSTLQDHEKMLSRVNDLNGLRSATISVATLEALQADVIAQVAGSFIQRYPTTRFEIHSMSADQIVPSVANGDAMLGLGFNIDLEPNVQDICAVPFGLGVVVGPDHPLANKSALRLSDCAGHAVALPAKTLNLRWIIDRMLGYMGVSLHSVAESNSIDLLKSLVTSANLATFLTRADVDFDRVKGNLLFVPLVDHRGEAQTLRLIQRKGVPLPPAAGYFAEDLGNFIRSMSDSV
jgi:molybdate transport repressor ModE-like protein